jgi:hypothetical protein
MICILFLIFRISDVIIPQVPKQNPDRLKIYLPCCDKRIHCANMQPTNPDSQTIPTFKLEVAPEILTDKGQ